MRRSAEVSYICSEIMHIICRFTYKNCEKCLTKQSRSQFEIYTEKFIR